MFFLDMITSSLDDAELRRIDLPKMYQAVHACTIESSPRPREQEAILHKIELEGFRLMLDFTQLSLVTSLETQSAELLSERSGLRHRTQPQFGDILRRVSKWIRFVSKRPANASPNSIQIKALADGVERCRRSLDDFMARYPNSSAEADAFNLHLAVERNELGIVKWLLGRPGRSCFDPYFDDKGRTALQIAARCGHTEVVKLLLAADPEGVKKVDPEGKTAIFLATEGRHQEIVAVLLAVPYNRDRLMSLDPSDADIPGGVRDRRGKNLLGAALGEGGKEVFDFLLRHAVSPITWIGVDVYALLAAAAVGDRDKATELLDKGVDVNIQDRIGRNALYEASRFGHPELVTLLLESGADAKGIEQRGGQTALHGIVDRGRGDAELFELLARYPEYQTRHNGPPLEFGHLDVAKQLLKSGADIDEKNFDGLTVLESLHLELEYCRRYDSPDNEANLLLELQEILQNPPAVEVTAMRTWNALPPKLDDALVQVCDYFKLRIQYHRPGGFKARMASLNSFIYSRSDGDQEKFDRLDAWAREARDNWTWIHLPANNVGRHQ